VEDVPETHYAKSGSVHIAYQVTGDGPRDLVFVPGVISHLDLWWEDPIASRFFRRLASLGRLILFDKRGTGLSDPDIGEPTLEQRMEDLQAILDACDSRSASLMGYSEGGPMSVMFAAAHPEVVSALILAAAPARTSAAPDFPCGAENEHAHLPLRRIMEERWGEGESIEFFAPSLAGSKRARLGFARWERMAATPNVVRGMSRLFGTIDVRALLPTIQAPTLVVQRLNDRVTLPCQGRYLADHIPGARYFEQAGDHVLWLGDTDELFEEIEEFLTGARGAADTDRVLATVMFTDLVGSTKRAAALGDRRWQDLLSDHDAATRRALERYRGHEITTTGDGFLATFDGPARAIRCACAIRDEARELGLEIRAGLHTGEVEVRGRDITGIAVHIGQRVSSLAGAGEVMVSGTVRDLVVGSKIQFEERGEHALKGIDGSWRLFCALG
jgi:class 3 adenylate cyclase